MFLPKGVWTISMIMLGAAFFFSRPRAGRRVFRSIQNFLEKQKEIKLIFLENLSRKKNHSTPKKREREREKKQNKTENNADYLSYNTIFIKIECWKSGIEEKPEFLARPFERANLSILIRITPHYHFFRVYHFAVCPLTLDFV